MRQSSKFSIWSGLILLALCGAQPSQAADFSAPTYQDPPAFSWSGAYVGAHGGLGFTGSPNPFADRNGVALGVQAGYNMQAGPGIVGAEIEGSYLGDTEHKVNGGKLKEKWRGAIKAKAGLTFDQTLVYGTAGYAMTSYKKGGDCVTTSASRAAICSAPAWNRPLPAASPPSSNTTTSRRPMSAPTRAQAPARKTSTATSSRPASTCVSDGSDGLRRRGNVPPSSAPTDRCPCPDHSAASRADRSGVASRRQIGAMAAAISP